MTQKRTPKKKKGSGDNFLGRLFAQTRIPAHVTEEQDWYLDTPDVRLTRVFTIVLILHVVAVGGILAFKMVEKASTPESVIAESGTAEAGTASSQDTKQPESAPPEVTSPATPPKPANPKPQQKRAEEMKAGLVVEHPSAPGYRQYRVAAGDNLVGIAREMKVSADSLRELNHLGKDARLMPGKWLTIPGEPKKATEPKRLEPKPAVGGLASAESERSPVKPIAERSPTDSKKAPGTYEVQKGDTFFGIARQFGLNYKDLMAANGIESAEGLQAGMELRIPAN